MPGLYIPSIYEDHFNGATYLSAEHNDAMLTLFERGQAANNLQLIYPLMIARDDCDTVDRKCKRELKNVDKLIDKEVDGDENDRIRHRQDIALARSKYNKYKILFEYRLSELIKIIERDA